MMSGALLLDVGNGYMLKKNAGTTGDVMSASEYIQ